MIIPLNKTRLISGLPLIAALSLSTGCFSTDLAGQPGSPQARCATPADDVRLADQVLQLINLERTEVGLPPVKSNAVLAKIAGGYACRMIEDDFFGHEDPLNGYGPGERAIAGDYRYFSVGENLAAGLWTPADAMKVWMESPSHRNIILGDQWKDVGVSVRRGGRYGIYWVQEFGEPVEE